MKSLTIHCPNLLRLDLFAGLLAAELADSDLLLLHGELGAGKTTFCQLLCRHLGVGEDQYVSSPSFALVHEYQGRLPIFHLDLYRLESAWAIEEAGLADYLDGGGLCLVEWPERLGPLTPEQRLELRLDRLADESRLITLAAHGPRWREVPERFGTKNLSA